MSTVRPRTPTAAPPDTTGRTRVDLETLIAMRLRVPRALQALSLTPKAARAGGHAGRLRGRGVDYMESRAYQAGDDVRHLDWRLTARSGRLHTKLFQEERERTLMLLVDGNASMRFGTRQRFKSVQAARAAALAAWYAAQAGERVGVLGYGGSRGVQRAAVGQRGALAVCGALARWDAAFSAQPAELLESALQRIRPLLAGASRVILVSDGHSCGDAARARLASLRQRTPLAVLIVADVLELAPPPPGRYALAHDGQREVLDLRDGVARRRFQQALGAGPARLAQLCDELHLPRYTLDTRSDPYDVVTALLGRPPRRDA